MKMPLNLNINRPAPPRLLILLWLGLLLGIGGCSTSPYSKPDQAANPSISSTVKTALAQLDRPYRYGGESPRGFDCSGLVYYAYQRSGIAIPRTSVAQYRASRAVSLTEIMPGDLLFFRERKRKPSHVGLYVGNGRFIHASTSEGAVILSSLDSPYWQTHLLGVGRYPD